MKELAINTSTGNLSATIYRSSDQQSVLVIASATGVKQTYYKKFAEFIATNGITVITFDYTGIGSSLNTPIKQIKKNAKDWGTQDLESIVKYVNDNYPNTKKQLIGHSMGGQLIGLSKSTVNFDNIIVVAAQSGYWKFWKGFNKLKMWFNWHVLFPSLIFFYGYVPSEKISKMENLPKNVAKQWSGWGRHKEYLFKDISLDKTVFNTISAKLTAISIDDDLFAPKKAVDWMTNKYSNATIKRIHLVPKDHGVKRIGHFGIFKETFKNSLWKLILKELT